MKLKHILILQNKIDLVKEGQAKEQYEQILKFVQGKKWHQCHLYEIWCFFDRASYYRIISFTNFNAQFFIH